LLIILNLALQERTCYEPLASTHPDTQGDGGTIIELASGELTAFLTKFKPQSLNTDANGLPT
jgi:hypothetical protein